MFSLDKKTAFPFNFLFMKSKGAKFACECVIILGYRSYRNCFQKGLIFLENEKSGFFCFHRVTKTHQDKGRFSYASQCGRVAKSSGLCSALT